MNMSVHQCNFRREGWALIKIACQAMTNEWLGTAPSKTNSSLSKCPNFIPILTFIHLAS